MTGIDIVVYDVAELARNWTPDDCDGHFNTWNEFRDSSMFPFNANALGEVTNSQVLLDDETSTIVVLINDPTAGKVKSSS